jgi:hypothetical protein
MLWLMYLCPPAEKKQAASSLLGSMVVKRRFRFHVKRVKKRKIILARMKKVRSFALPIEKRGTAARVFKRKKG